jgi:hypothetical protein
VGDYLEFFPKQTAIALLRATKRGTKAANTLAARLVSKDMGIKVGDVKSRIRVKVPTAQTMTGELRASLKRIPLIKFGARGPEPSRGRGRGVTTRGKGGRSRIPSAFIATMPATGHRGVFKREGVKRVPISQLYGPSVGHVFVAHEKEITDRGEEQLLGELNRQLDRIME